MPNTRYSKPRIVKMQPLTEEEPEVEKVLLVLRKNVILNITGKHTGEVYHFSGAGAKVWVEKNDADIMMKRELQVTCCKGISQPYFEIAQEGVI